MDWRIYYADGSTFEGKPENAPGLGVIVIVQKHKDTQIGSYLQHQSDYYVWAEGYWWGCDLFRLWQYWFVQKYPHPKVSLAGETIKNELYDQIIRSAKDDKDFFQ